VLNGALLSDIGSIVALAGRGPLANLVLLEGTLLSSVGSIVPPAVREPLVDLAVLDRALRGYD
jgi:hypothetical protein